DVHTGKINQTLRHSGAVVGVAFREGSHLATASGDGTRRIWDSASGRERSIKEVGNQAGEESSNLSRPPGTVYTFALSGDGKRLAAVSINGTSKIWDLDLESLPRVVDSRMYLARLVALSYDGRLLAISSADKKTRIFDIDSGRSLSSIDSTFSISGLGFSLDNRRIAIASVDGSVHLQDVRSGVEMVNLSDSSVKELTLALSSDGKKMATATQGNDVKLKLKDASSGLNLLPLEHADARRDSVPAFSSDGQYLAALGSDNIAHVWRTADGRKMDVEIQISQGPKPPALAVSTDGQRLAAITPDGLRIRDTYGKTLSPSADGSADTSDSDVRSLAFSPDGSLLATAGAYGAVKVREAGSGRVRLSLPADAVSVGHKDAVTALVFSPDSRVLATGSNDKTVKLWDSKSGALSDTLLHPAAVSAISFSSDSALLASATSESITLWNVKKHQQLLTVPLNKTDGEVRLAFHPDGNLIAVSRSQVFHEYPSKTEDLLAEARRHLNQSWTEEECQHYFRTTCPKWTKALAYFIEGNKGLKDENVA